MYDNVHWDSCCCVPLSPFLNYKVDLNYQSSIMGSRLLRPDGALQNNEQQLIKLPSTSH